MSKGQLKTKEKPRVRRALVTAVADELESRNNPYRAVTIPMAAKLFGKTEAWVIEVIDRYGVPYVLKTSGRRQTREFPLNRFSEATQKWWDNDSVR